MGSNHGRQLSRYIEAIAREFHPQDILHFIASEQAKANFFSGMMQYVDKHILPEEPMTACKIIVWSRFLDN